MLAAVARRHALPFYVAAPLSTFDPKIANGWKIPIEERAPDEVTGYRGTRWAPQGIGVRNPAFDVTPAAFVSAIVCEKGLVREPNPERVSALWQ
jgi:methylthioribose-1-phosphate isomerase